MKAILLVERRIQEVRNFIQRLRNEIAAFKRGAQVTVAQERQVLAFENHLAELHEELAGLQEIQALYQDSEP